MLILNWKKTFMAAGLLLLLLVPSPLAMAAETFKLTVIHTNDFHGYDPYALARKATLIKKIRAEEPNVLLLDAGDIYTRGPYHTVFFGTMEMAAMNALHYDAWELGNNEFKGLQDPAGADEKLYELIHEAQFPTLCANIRNLDDSYLEGVQPYIVKEVQGQKIGIVGVSSLKVKKYPQGENKIVEDPVDAVKRLLPEVQEQSDIQLILSHAGLAKDVQMDMKLASQGPALIVGADDHYVITTPIWRSGGIPIVQAGGEVNVYLGRVDLTFEKRDGKWVETSHSGWLYPITEDIPMDGEIKSIIDGYLASAGKQAA